MIDERRALMHGSAQEGARGRAPSGVPLPSGNNSRSEGSRPADDPKRRMESVRSHAGLI